MSVLVPIGDFSRMTHLSVKALRFYHDQGLLEPARIDPSSGYRFYDTGQVPVAQVIRRFRDLDMPLDQVRAVLKAPDLETRTKEIIAHLSAMEIEQAGLTPAGPGGALFPNGFFELQQAELTAFVPVDGPVADGGRAGLVTIP